MRAIDFAVFSWFNAPAGTPAWAIQAGVFISDWLPALVFALFALGAAVRPAWRRAFWAAAVSALIIWLIVTFSRWAIPMPRPAQFGLGIQWAHQGVRPGFPSMHASGAFAVAMSAVFLRCWPVAAVTVPAALLITWSRLFLGLHFPSDVLAGMLLGTAVAALVCWASGYFFSRGTRPIK
jgi:undecaprenyl-diphosphatase